jgi:hypothetical protein
MPSTRLKKEGRAYGAALYDNSNPYNVGIATNFSMTFEGNGGKVSNPRPTTRAIRISTPG